MSSPHLGLAAAAQALSAMFFWTTFKTAAGEETGDAYYVSPGHTPILYALPLAT